VGVHAADEEVVEEEILIDAPRPSRSANLRTREPRTRSAGWSAVRQGPTNSVTRATATGLILAAIVAASSSPAPCPWPRSCSLPWTRQRRGLRGFRSVGAHPASPLGIVAVLTLGIAVYNKGTAAYGAVSVLLLIFGFIWYINAQKSVDVLDGSWRRLMVYVWVGVLGSYGLLLIAPSSFPDGHGLSYLFGAMLLAVANDSGALFTGRRFGRHPLNARLSPNKTREGLIGGTVVTLLVAYSSCR